MNPSTLRSLDGVEKSETFIIVDTRLAETASRIHDKEQTLAAPAIDCSAA